MKRGVLLAIVVVVGLIGGGALALGRVPTRDGAAFVAPSPVPSIAPMKVITTPADFKIVREDVRRVLDRPVVLAWTPGGIDPSFVRRLGKRVPEFVVVRSGNAWMTSSRDRDGGRVDHVTGGDAIPLETAAIDPKAYLGFVLPPDRWMLEELAASDSDQVPGAILGETSARLRRVRAGGELELQGARVRVIGVIPDEFVGAHEVVVGLETGRRLGIERERYVLIDPGSLRRAQLASRVESAAGRPVQIRFPGETPYLRHGDAVQPQVILKERFGEFAAQPTAGGMLRLAPGFAGDLETRRVPLLGMIRCNEAIMPQLIGAMKELRRRSLGRFVHQNDGCYSPRFLNRDPEAGISHHTWGVAFDINASENPFGAKPVLNEQVVEVMERWGFTWGGDWIVPDGMHFEWIGPPRQAR